MISVVIPTLNTAPRFAECLTALAPAALDGLLKEVVVVDGGSTDGTRALAEAAGARVMETARGRGLQLRAGADAARAPWLLFLHADTVLEETWADEARARMDDETRAGVFSLAFDHDDIRARIVASGAAIRSRVFLLPYGDQGLFISKSLYAEAGGYRDHPLFEDVDFVERIVAKRGRRALHFFRARAVTSAERYRRNGYARQVLANFIRVARYKMGRAPADLARDYASR